MRIVFFGTPEFAVPSLRTLIGEGHDVVGVVTQPDKPRGRSRSVLVPPPVKSLALEHELTVLQPDRPTGELFGAREHRLANPRDDCPPNFERERAEFLKGTAGGGDRGFDVREYSRTIRRRSGLVSAQPPHHLPRDLIDPALTQPRQ